MRVRERGVGGGGGRQRDRDRLPKRRQSDYRCLHPHGLNGLATESGRWSPDWNVSMVDIRLRKLLWIYCPGHAGVKGNDRADRLAGKATLGSGLLFGRSKALRSLRHYLQAQSQWHHTIGRPEERDVERGSARRSSFKGREKATVSQTNIATVSKAVLGKLLTDGVKRI